MEYPYYIVPVVEQYRKLDPKSEEAKKLSRKITANIGDLAALRLVLGIDPPEFGRFYPDMNPVTPDTLDTIDSFLDKFGGEITPMVYVPGDPDESSEDDQDKKFNEEFPQTFSLLVKDKRFEEALKLIERQNLINPQKSIYFALQIRFLKKLMAIENFRKQTNG